MKRPRINRSAALRIGLAARALPDADAQSLVPALTSVLGPSIDEETLCSLDRDTLRQVVEKADIAASTEELDAALGVLKGSLPAAYEVPTPQPDIDVPGSIKVAVASNEGERADGHFGSCARFLIYRVSPEKAVLVDVRSTADLPKPTADEDKNLRRAELINDCQVLCVVSIGGPAAAKAVKAGLFPLKTKTPEDGFVVLERLRQALSSPPPWLAKVMGESPTERQRFRTEWGE